MKNEPHCIHESTSCADLGPLYTRSLDHESLGPNNSILNIILHFTRYFIKVYLGSKKGVGFQKLYRVFCWIMAKRFWAQNGAT
jgi:hypothetical protein